MNNGTSADEPHPSASMPPDVGESQQNPPQSYGDSYLQGMLGTQLNEATYNSHSQYSTRPSYDRMHQEHDESQEGISETPQGSHAGITGIDAARDLGDTQVMSYMSKSQPAPQLEADLEETQVHSLERPDVHLRPYQSRGPGSSCGINGQATNDPERPQLEAAVRDGERSMDLTVAHASAQPDHQMLPAEVESDADTILNASSSGQHRDVELPLPPTQRTELSDSQKENSRPPGPTPSSHLPYRQQQARLTPHGSLQQTESNIGPSSSPAVAANLLAGRLSPSKRVYQSVPSSFSSNVGGGGQEHELGPTTSGTAPNDNAELLSSAEEPNRAKSSKSMPNLLENFPETSTPAFAGAHPPQPPLTVARTVPNLAHTSRAPIPVAAQAVYQSSTAMKSIPNKSPKKQRDEWGDTSQETTQDSRQHEESGAPRTTQEAIEEDAQAMATMGLRELSAELDKSRDMSIADESYADKSAETTIGVVAAATAVDADRLRVDELNSSPRQHLDSSPQGTIRGSSAAQTMSLAPQQAQTRSVEESEEDNRLREQFEDAETQREGPLFGPAVGNQSRSELQSQSQALSGPEPISQSSQSEQHTGTGSIPFPSSAASRINERILNLTDIGGMNSSQVEQTQIEIEATQLEYDVEKLPPAPSMSAPTSDALSFQRQIRPVADETFDVDSSRKQSTARSGRELRRIPPPPTPAGLRSLPPTIPVAQSATPQFNSTSVATSSPVITPSAVNDDSMHDSPSMLESHADIAKTQMEETQSVSSSPSSRAGTQHIDEPSSNLAAPEHTDPRPASASSNAVVPDSEGPTQRTPSPQKEASALDGIDMDLDDDSTQMEIENVERNSAEINSLRSTTRAQSHVESSRAPSNLLVRKPKHVQAPVAQGPGTSHDQTGTIPVKGRARGQKSVHSTPESPDELDLFQPTHPPRRKQANGLDQPRSEPMKGPNQGAEDIEVIDIDRDDSSPELSLRRQSPSETRTSTRSSPASSRKRRRASSSVEVLVEVPERVTKRHAVAEKQEVKAKGKAKPVKRIVGGSGTAEVNQRDSNKEAAAVSRPRSEVRSFRDDFGSSSESEQSDHGGSIAGAKKGSVAKRKAAHKAPRRASVAASEQEHVMTTASGVRIKLPASAPFIRVFAIWRDDGWLYPATVIGVAAGKLSLCFDDDSRGKFKYSEVRHAQLERGDYIRYRGNEDMDAATQADKLREDLRVYRIERGDSDGPVDGSIEPSDVVVATRATLPLEDQAEEQRKDRATFLLVEAIAVAPEHAAQFDNRKLSPAEIAGFEGRTKPKPLKALKLLDIPAARDVEPLVINHKSGLFSRCAFLVTTTEDTGRVSLSQMLQEQGGSVIHLSHLAHVRSGQDAIRRLVFDRAGFERIDTILCLADRPCTTAKYLVSLALGIPCVSSHFVATSIAENNRLDWKDFLLSSGFLQSIGTFAVGAQIRSVGRKSFNLDSIIALSKDGGVFTGRSLLVVPKQQGKNAHDEIRQLQMILVAAGASKVDFVGTAEKAQNGGGYDHVVLPDDRERSEPLRAHKSVGSHTWMKQCLIAGRLLPPSMMKEAQPVAAANK